MNAIIGGKPASGLSADIVVNINGHCAGVFLDQNYVLTVASCLVNKTLSGEPTLKPEQVVIHHHCLHAPWSQKILWQHRDREKNHAASMLQGKGCGVT